jgi:PPP family 3-phenylpropionic acid transporter
VFFVVVGLHLPFWPLWLEAKGFGPEAIAVIVAIGIGAKVVSNPLVAHVADRRGERRRPMLFLALASVASFALFLVADDFLAVVLVSFAFSACLAPIMALAESLTMLAVHRGEGGPTYGRIRLWGSLSFILVAAGGGQLLTGRSPDLLFWLILAAVAATVLAAALLPDLRTTVSTTTELPLIDVVRRPGLVRFLAAAALIQASHAVYYAFATLHWRAAGLSEAVVGALWAEGVIAEIILFAWGDRILRLRPVALLAVAGAAGVVRWTATALSDDLAVLVAVQALHAFTYGAAHLAAIHFLARAVPAPASASAQSLYSAGVMGLALGAALMVSGRLYAAFAGGAFLGMAALALMGTGIALSGRRSQRVLEHGSESGGLPGDVRRT